MIDVHCHLNFHSFEKDYDEVIKSAFQAGVTKIINVGTKIDSSALAVDLAQRYDSLYAIVGVHPHHADKPEEGWLEELERLAKKPASNAAAAKVVGIGEIGLDYFSYKSNDIVDPKLQRDVFIKQIELAHKLKLPLQIHNRQAGKDILDILISHKSLLLNSPGMFHCFAGSLDLLKKILDLGFYVGFDGNITYSGLAPGEDTDLKDLVKYTPIDRIVVETDSPFLTPEPYRGSRNKPEYVIITAKFIAKVKSTTFEEIEAKTTKNVIELFAL
ncbi:MAG: TatD family hydrolase [Candidatus Parcubacteria bacterium]|nr:TatD family hydrolase [Candidatus Parcubacteria bacterium]